MPDRPELPMVLHRYRITDERTGKRRLRTWHMTAQVAAERYGADATPEASSWEERHSVWRGEQSPHTRPPEEGV